jgi:ribonuclease HII
MRPHLEFEKKHWQNDCLVLGIDEVGRGAFAGPLVVGGAIFSKCCDNSEVDNLIKSGINDSKKLSEKKRENLYSFIKNSALFTTTVFIPVAVINKIGIAHATHVAMQQVVFNATQLVDKFFVLTDAFEIPNMTQNIFGQLPIVHGDEISISIAAASIIAKVERDRYMKKLAQKYPDYGFEKHVGYGTAAHRRAIQTLGPTKIHRLDFIKKTNYSL